MLNGEKTTGVTTMLMAEGLDTGDMLLSEETEIGIDETASELHDRLSEIGAKVMLETVKAVKEGTLVPRKQNDDESSYSPMLSKDLCPLDFTKSAQEIHNRIRGLSDWPCATAMLGEKKIKIFRSALTGSVSGKVGEIVDEKNFVVACGDGNGIAFREVQAEGGKRMSAADYLRGNRIEKGTILR